MPKVVGAETLTHANILFAEKMAAQAATPVLGPMGRLGMPPPVPVSAPYASPGQATVRSAATDFPEFLREKPVFQKLDPEPKQGRDPLALLFTHSYSSAATTTADDTDHFNDLYIGGDGQRLRKYKTEMCKYFQLGCCKRGTECTFAHSGDELRPADEAGPRASDVKPSARPEEGELVSEEERNLRARKYKTEMCKYWQQRACKRGRECTFAHSASELRGKDDDFEAEDATPKFTPASLAPPKKYKTEMCKFFALGTCKRSRDCTFAHSVAELRGAADKDKEPSGGPPMSGTFPEMCKYWAMGSCKRGRECAYAHSRAELGQPYASRREAPPVEPTGRERSDTSGTADRYYRQIDMPRRPIEVPRPPPGLREPEASDDEAGVNFHLPSDFFD